MNGLTYKKGMIASQSEGHAFYLLAFTCLLLLACFYLLALAMLLLPLEERFDGAVMRQRELPKMQ
ncbi:hypothetical protein AB4Z29_13660 [Paenibacillus sp. 2TAB23]|uniref:hypothetical protein n=1 Tax=Paenibacillus sp. 2TAB23 TaxID=3233004 RepID=UPI003F9E0D8D